jgi:sulfur transfer complex TusBCD TusB component (DsrH family)
MLGCDDFCEDEVIYWFKDNIDKIKLLEDCINLCIDESFYCDEAKINIIFCIKDIMMDEYDEAFDKELMELERETEIIKNRNYNLPW